MPTPSSATRYDLTLEQIEACNCPPNCPCQFGELPTHTSCEFLIGFHVRKGTFGQVKLDGAKFVVMAHYPGAIHQGNGSAVLFVDEAMSDPQVAALGEVMSGKHGGMPWEALAATVSSLEGPVRVKLEMTLDGTRSRVRVPGVLDVQQTPLTDSVSGADKEVHVVYPKGGFFWDDGNICKTAVMQGKHGKLAFSHSESFGAHAVARWTNVS
jgi:hypothetical protein